MTVSALDAMTLQRCLQEHQRSPKADFEHHLQRQIAKITASVWLIATNEDLRYIDLLENTKKVANVNVEDYDAIYLTGGHGTMFDFRQSKALETLMARFYETGRIVSTVCHSATGLLNVNLSNGEPLIKGKKVTGFSWPEEIIAKRDNAVPFNLEEELKKLGADYSKAGKPFEVHVIGRLITGQNPGSARAVAEAVIRRLKTKADSN